jgi:CNT family concentrative nucleoside transporter
VQEWLQRGISVIGLIVLIGIAWGLSEKRRSISMRILLWGVCLQFAIAVVMLKTPVREPLFRWTQKAVDVLTSATIEGAKFVFGNLTTDFGINAIVAFQVLPVIILVSAISGILYHLHVIQVVVRGIAWLMRRTLGTSGAETFSSALQIFLGIESMTALRGYLAGMTRSELCTVMTTFMANIAGSVMIVYAGFGAEPGHLLTASLMSAPAAILISKLLVPETGTPQTADAAHIEIPVESHNVIDAASRGTSEGLSLALNVGAMLIAFIALVYLLDLFFQTITGFTFIDIMSVVFYPVAFLFGVPSTDLPALSALLAKKTVLNEFLAYVDLQEMIKGGTISERGRMIATYALCGFANPGSTGVLIAGMSGLVPERRGEISALSMKAFIGGTLSSFMTACVAGILA